MKALYIFCCILLLGSCHRGSQQVAVQVPAEISDTAFLKTIRWDSLNSFVAYHILKQGVKTNDTGIRYTIKCLAVYAYLTHSYEYMTHGVDLLNQDTPVGLTSSELREFILSDSFSGRRSFDCLIKVNSEIYYKIKKDPLWYVGVRPKDPKNESALIAELKKEKYAAQVISKTTRQSASDTGFVRILHDSSENRFIQIILKPEYRDLSKIKTICDQLKQRESLRNVFYNDLFTGPNESETIFRIRTKEKEN